MGPGVALGSGRVPASGLGGHAAEPIALAFGPAPIAVAASDGLEVPSGSTAWSDFSQSLVIILREGLEAILIIGALLAFLTHSANAQHRPSIYWGAGVAIAASIVTAILFEVVFGLAEASREFLEGVTMLLAVVVLFSVSYWLVSKVEHKRWERYIRDKMSLALSRPNRFALASVAFLAVYREGFETVLFYKALMGGATSGATVFGGFGLGVAALFVICLLIYQFGVRIPLRPFFATTSAILYYMAFVFAGRGIHELQEAGALGETKLTGVHRVDLLGIYPTAEGLMVQGFLLGALIGALVWTFVVAAGRGQVRELAGPTGSD